jgi:pyruvate/2-oxoglutarate dehydrogenase complex dihydrolipoamide dehydrogenase (E3) component
LTDWLSKELQRLGVEIVLKTDLKGEAIVGLRADDIILATGSMSFTPSIPGINPKHVLTASRILEKGIHILEGK